MPSLFYHGRLVTALTRVGGSRPASVVLMVAVGSLAGCSALTETPPPEAVAEASVVAAAPADAGAAKPVASAQPSAAPSAQPPGPPEKITSTTLALPGGSTAGAVLIHTRWRCPLPS